FLEAEAWNGPSIIIAYSHCIAHGINMATGFQNQKAAVDSGQWVIYRYNPENTEKGLPPLTLDCKAPKLPLNQYLMMENRFKMLLKTEPDRAKTLFAEAQKDVEKRWQMYEHLA